MRQRAIPIGTLGRELATVQIFINLVVGSDHTGASAGFDRHIAHGQSSFNRQAADGRSGEFNDMAGGTGGADFGDDRQHHILAGDARRELAVDDDAQGFRPFQPQALRGEDLFQLGGAGAEGVSAQRAMR